VIQKKKVGAVGGWALGPGFPALFTSTSRSTEARNHLGAGEHGTGILVSEIDLDRFPLRADSSEFATITLG